MKIAVIGSKGLPPRQGGIEHHCAEIYPRMVKRGHTVELYARSSYTLKMWGQRTAYKGIAISHMPSVYLKGADALVSSALAAAIASGKRYDIIHFHALGPSLFTPLPKIFNTAKIVVTCHGLDWKRSKWGAFSSRVIRLGEQTAVRTADGIIAVSQDIQTYLQDTYGRASAYISNAPATYPEFELGFDYGASLGLESQRYILFLGRLVPEKCPDLLIQAFQRLQLPGWKLVLAGGNSDASDFAARLRYLAREQPNIVFTGEIRERQLAEIVRNAGLFVLPSDVEGLPLAVLEAMNEEIPIVVSNIPSHQNLVGSHRGLLFTAGDIEDCMVKLKWAINHPDAMAVRVANAKQYVQLNHNWDAIVSEHIDFYHDLLNVPKSANFAQAGDRPVAQDEKQAESVQP